MRQDSPSKNYLQIQRYMGCRRRGIIVQSTVEVSSEVPCTILDPYLEKLNRYEQKIITLGKWRAPFSCMRTLDLG